MKWTERNMQVALSTAGFLSGSVCVIPNCNWTGNEADMLILEPNLRIIDIEIKVSRADLKADAKKAKWWHRRPWSRRHKAPEPRQWPDKVWKHYYAFPRELWTDDLFEHIPANSGVLLVFMDTAHRRHDRGSIGVFNHGILTYAVKRRAKPNKDAKPIGVRDAIDLARLASLRAWALIREANRITMTEATN